MTKDTIVRLRKIYKILLSISIIITGICLIYGCLSIYFSGNDYSRDIVAKTFSQIDIPVFVSLALIVIDIIWELVSPSTSVQKKAQKKFDTTPNTTTNKNVKITKLIILGIAIITLVLGAIFGGYADVLTKAVNICTECIGLG